MRQLIKECLRDYVDRLDRVKDGESRFNPAENCALKEMHEYKGGFKLLIKYWETVLSDEQYYYLSFPFMSLRVQRNLTLNFSLGPWIKALALDKELSWNTGEDQLLLVHLTLVSRSDYFAVWWSKRHHLFTISTQLDHSIPELQLRRYAEVMNDLSLQSRSTIEDQQLTYETLVAELELKDTVDWDPHRTKPMIPMPFPRKLNVRS